MAHGRGALYTALGTTRPAPPSTESRRTTHAPIAAGCCRCRPAVIASTAVDVMRNEMSVWHTPNDTPAGVQQHRAKWRVACKSMHARWASESCRESERVRATHMGGPIGCSVRLWALSRALHGTLTHTPHRCRPERTTRKVPRTLESVPATTAPTASIPNQRQVTHANTSECARRGHPAKKAAL